MPVLFTEKNDTSIDMDDMDAVLNTKKRIHPLGIVIIVLWYTIAVTTHSKTHVQGD